LCFSLFLYLRFLLHFLSIAHGVEKANVLQEAAVLDEISQQIKRQAKKSGEKKKPCGIVDGRSSKNDSNARMCFVEVVHGQSLFIGCASNNEDDDILWANQNCEMKKKKQTSKKECTCVWCFLRFLGWLSHSEGEVFRLQFVGDDQVQEFVQEWNVLSVNVGNTLCALFFCQKCELLHFSFDVQKTKKRKLKRELYLETSGDFSSQVGKNRKVSKNVRASLVGPRILQSGVNELQGTHIHNTKKYESGRRKKFEDFQRTLIFSCSKPR
jgi:hypothetical protein